LQQTDLSIKVTATTRRFAGLRIAIARRPALQDIRNVHDLPLQSDCPQHFIQQLSGLADERFTPPVLFSTRRFADDQEIRVRLACAENSLCSALVQVTAGTRCHRLLQYSPFGDRRIINYGDLRHFGYFRRLRLNIAGARSPRGNPESVEIGLPIRF
jgi:hypothetical protein